VEKKVDLLPRLLSVADAAKYLGLSAKTIRNRLGPKAKQPFPVKPKKIGRKVLFERADLDAFADGLSHV
jgi:predicted DNA-binding transcriptional regulator AlpA